MQLLKFERKFLTFIEQHLDIIFFIIISFLALFIRYTGLRYETNDYLNFLLPWYLEIKENGGLSSLNQLTGNYNVVYQFLIAILTYIPYPLSIVIKYKLLSIPFDFLLSFGCGLIGYHNTKSRKAFLAIYSITLFLPTVVLNSSFWAQCDAIYCAFLILFIYALIKEKYTLSFVFFALAFCFKLQAIFLLPFLIFVYLCNKKFSILNFLIIPVVYVLTGLPSLIQGLPFSDMLSVYITQTSEYDRLTLNYPNIFNFLPGNYYDLEGFGIFLTIFIIGIYTYHALNKKYVIKKVEHILLVSCWFCYTCIMFLPAMHERYGFYVDVVALLLVFMNRKYFFLIIHILISTWAYSAYLFNFYQINMVYVSIANLIVWSLCTYFVCKLPIEEACP